MTKKSGLSKFRLILSIVGNVPQLTSLPTPFILASGSKTKNTDSLITMYASIMTRFLIFDPYALVVLYSFSCEQG